MRILAFDTATARLTVALIEDEQVIARFDRTLGRGHAENLLPAISGVLREGGVLPSDLDGIAVSVGPGSYTGIRIGLATAKGFAFGQNLPVYGVSTLEAFAFPFISDSTEKIVVPVFDARGGRIFAAAFSGPGRILDDQQAEAITFAGKLSNDKEILLLGDGAKVLAPFIAGQVDLLPDTVIDAAAVAKLALRRKAKGDLGLAGDLKAFYAAPTQAERMMATDSKA